MTGLGIEAIADHQSIREVVLRRLRDAILDGAVAPGTRLKIDDLATELGVSHMPVREALQLLVVEGLAVHAPRRGVVVSQLTAEHAANAYDVMGVLEGLAARHAASTLSPAALAELRVLLERMAGELASGDRTALLLSNRAFHQRIYDAYPNTWSAEFLRQLWNHTYRLRRLYPQSLDRLRATAAEHQAIVAALEDCDGELAERLVRQHNERSRDDLLRQLTCDGPSAGAVGCGERPAPARTAPVAQNTFR
jgi:DNA-binding GntR family transcriptional regulator